MNETIQLSGLSIVETRKIIPDNTILLGYVGSIAHGTYVPKSDPDSIDDKDILGICILPEEQYLGLGFNPVLKGKKNKMNNEQQEVQEGEWDSVVYEIKKIFKLLLKQNPNVLSLLWLQEKDYIYISEFGRLILDNRKMFVSKEAYHSFIGYAHDQFHKMEPRVFHGYMGEKCKQLVEKYGYDCKNAAHLIRLLRMGIEYLTDGELKVYRQDARELKDIKSGKWKLDKVKECANKLFDVAQNAYVNSSLPSQPDYDGVNKMTIEILKSYFGF